MSNYNSPYASKLPEPLSHRSDYQSPGSNRIQLNKALDSAYLDPNSKYSINYGHRKTEGEIDHGSNLLESQTRVILLACEVERLTTLNYKLVKEIEILRS